MAIIGCTVCCALLIGAALATFFLFPRTPTVTEGGATVISFSLTSTKMSLDAQAIIEVKNPNYAAIELKSVHLNVSHQGISIGNIDKSDTNYPPKKTTSHAFVAKFQTSDATAVSNMNAELSSSGFVTLNFAGPVKASYLGVSITKQINFDKQVDPSQFGTTG